MVRQISSIEELASLVHLVEIRPFEFSGRATAPVSQEQNEPRFSLEFAERVSSTEIENRFRFDVTTDDARYLADIAAIYAIEEESQIPESVRIEFAERLGIMAVFPYIRESLSTSASRLGRSGPLLDLMRPGDMKIEINPND